MKASKKAVEQPVCNWKLSEPENRFFMYSLTTNCGLSQDLISGEPIPEGYNFCPYCGKELVIDG